MPIPVWFKEGAKWGGGTIAGIFVTWMFTSYVERARPSAEVAQITITNSDSDVPPATFKRIVSVPLKERDEEVFRELVQSAWTEAFRDPSDILGKVIAKLKRNKEYVEGYLSHAQDYRELNKDMTLLLSGLETAKTVAAFFDDWQQVDGFIYGSVRSQMRYGSSSLQRIGCEQEKDSRLNPKNEVNGGAPDSHIHLRKVKYRKVPDAQYFAITINIDATNSIMAVDSARTLTYWVDAF